MSRTSGKGKHAVEGKEDMEDSELSEEEEPDDDEDDEDGEETIYTAKEEECVARRGDVSYAYKEKRKQRGERKLTNCTWPRKRGRID